MSIVEVRMFIWICVGVLIGIGLGFKLCLWWKDDKGEGDGVI